MVLSVVWYTTWPWHKRCKEHSCARTWASSSGNPLALARGGCQDINNELKIINGNKSKKYDFSIISKKFIIEFNGDVYHANPIYNKADDIVKYAPKSLITASEIWKRDEQKIKFAEDAGYKVVVVWESEYKENKEKVINDLLEVISNEPIKWI